MQAHKMKVTVPEDHQLEIRLPRDFPAGPAEIIVLTGPSSGEGTQSQVSEKLLAALETLRTMERTEEEERVLEEFDHFREANPFNLTSLVDEDR